MRGLLIRAGIFAALLLAVGLGLWLLFPGGLIPGLIGLGASAFLGLALGADSQKAPEGRPRRGGLGGGDTSEAEASSAGRSTPRTVRRPRRGGF